MVQDMRLAQTVKSGDGPMEVGSWIILEELSDI